MKYVENSTATYANEASNVNLQKLHEKVLKLKESRELEENFRYLTEWLEEERKEGRQEGLEEGHSQMFKLIKCMVAGNEQELIPRLAMDSKFFEEMLEKYKL